MNAECLCTILNYSVLAVCNPFHLIAFAQKVCNIREKC